MVTFRRVSRQLQQGRVEWHNGAFTTTGLLRRFLTKEGWTTTAPWQFVHNSGYARFVERRINLRRFVDLSISQQGPTRSADVASTTGSMSGSRMNGMKPRLPWTSPEALHHQFDLINLKLTRDQTKISGDHRAVLLYAPM